MFVWAEDKEGEETGTRTNISIAANWSGPLQLLLLPLSLFLCGPNTSVPTHSRSLFKRCLGFASRTKYKGENFDTHFSYLYLNISFSEHFTSILSICPLKAVFSDPFSGKACLLLLYLKDTNSL